jgi:hypothetical protein
MLFRKKIRKSCGYCINGTVIADDEILCVKRGVVSPDKSCRKFEYDPCKRIPLKAKAPDFDKYSNDDFTL